MTTSAATQHRPDTRTNQLVVFTLNNHRYGLPLPAVERIVNIVDVTPLPHAPDIVLGVVNVQGRVIPVINVRRRFHLSEREIALTDRMVVAHTARRPVALVVDAVIGVLEYSEQEAVGPQNVLPDLRYVEGVVKLDSEMILIHNLDKFLSLEEETALERAMEDA
jgi:purine-binding chemotaxis protein CheW